MERITWGSNDTNVYEGRNIRGLSLLAVIQHTTLNTAFAANPLDWSKIYVKVTLERGGRKINVHNDVALPAIMESGFYNAQYQNSQQIGTYQQHVLQVQTAGLDAIILLPGVINFHEVINVKGKDRLIVDIQVPSGALGATASVAECFMYYDIIEGIGVGKSVPVIEAESIRASVSSAKVSAGDDVVSATFVNSDKTGITTANQVLTNCNVISDKFGLSDDYNELLAKRSQAFVSGSESDLRSQSFRLFDMLQDNLSGMKVRLNKVLVDLTLTGANVTASKNWVVVRRYENDAETKQRALASVAKHIQQNMSVG